jgi:hypothetical protein
MADEKKSAVTKPMMWAQQVVAVAKYLMSDEGIGADSANAMALAGQIVSESMASPDWPVWAATPHVARSE